MSVTGFLLDEHIALRLQAQLLMARASMRVVAIGDDGAPPVGTPDPVVLTWIESNDCYLVTNNRASMPGHLRQHCAQGHHVPGIFVVPRRLNYSLLLEDLLLIWEAALPGEFQDQVIYLPLHR